MILNSLLLVIGFVALIKCADWFVEGASSLAKRLKMSDLLIGLTVVAFGTSAPELFVNLFAAAADQTDIALANVLGSNICNVLLILGLSALIYPLSVRSSMVKNELPLNLFIGLVLSAMVYFSIKETGSAVIDRLDATILIAIFLFFLWMSYKSTKGHENETGEEIKELTWGKTILLLSVGLAGLIVGGKLIVDSAVEIASKMGIDQTIIGLTIVAVGTSLPELATSVIAAYKKNSDIAIGNVIGSNIFNIVFILGITSFIKEIPVKEQNLDIIWMNLFVSAIPFAVIYIGKKHVIQKWQGLVFLLLYFSYIGYEISKTLK